MKKLFSVISVTIIFFATTSLVHGQYGQYGQPSPSQSILIDKMVGRADSPITKGGITDISYVDNLTPTDPRFKPTQDVYFRLRVKNTSDIAQQNVVVRDYFPAYIDPVDGPGTFDSNIRVITFNAGDFAANEEKVYFIHVKLVGQNAMPADKGLFCLVNRVTASNNNVSDEDTAQFCVEKQVTPVPATPSSGPEFGLALMAGEAVMFVSGMLLIKKNNKPRN